MILNVLVVALLAGAAYSLSRWWTVINDDVPAAPFEGDTTTPDTDTTIPMTYAPPKRSGPYLAAIRAAEASYGLPTNLLVRLLELESGYLPDIVSGKIKSPKGAVGIAQFLPYVAKSFNVNPLNADEAIKGAARYLSQLQKRFGDWKQAAAAYNWGPTNLARYGFEKAPKATREYVEKIAVVL